MLRFILSISFFCPITRVYRLEQPKTLKVATLYAFIICTTPTSKRIEEEKEDKHKDRKVKTYDGGGLGNGT